MLIRPVLILAGTSEARELAALLIERDFEPISSFAGVTENPVLPLGRVRKGGFGSVQGMMGFVSGEVIVAIADASHPFATRISANAVSAAERLNIPYFRLERPAWTPVSDDHWISAKNILHAARLIPPGSRVLVTTGRKELVPFLERDDVSGVVRTIELPDIALPGNWSFHIDRPPFSRDAEWQLFAAERIDILVTKNAGGEATRAKLDVARERKIPVIMVERPAKPPSQVFWPAAALVDQLEKAIIA